MKILAKQNRELIMINAQNTQNENDAEKIILKVPEQYEDFNKKIVFVTPDGIVWDLIVNNEYLIPKAITKYKQVDFYIWLTKDDEDWRSKTETIKFYDNKDASGEITPEEISGVNTVINLLEDEIDKVERLNITAEKVGKVTTLTITYKDGTQGTFEILDGNDGADGQDGEDYVITQEDYQAIANIVASTINVPTKTSDLTNDSGFIDNTVSNLTNYYNKNQSYNKDEIDGKLSSIYKYKGSVATYSDLPSIDVRVGDVYNVEEDGSNYAWNGTEWDKLGGDVDLSNYYNKTQTDTLLNGKVDNSTLNDYYTKTRTDELLNTKVDKTTYNSKVEEIETELGEKIEESDLADYVKDTDVDNIIQEKSLINQTQLEESQTAQDELISELQEENKELYDAMAKVTGSGTDVTLNNTAKGKMPIEVSGNTEQDGEPTPEEESPVKVVTGNNTVVVGNKNIFDKNNITEPGVLLEYTNNKWEVATNNPYFNTTKINNILPNTDYVGSYISTDTTWGFRIVEYDKNNNIITGIKEKWDNVIKFKTQSNTVYIKVCFNKDVTSNIQIEESTTSTSYEEHKETRLPLNLGSIELCKIGEYKDYPWKDESTGKWYVKKLIDKVVLDGSENFQTVDNTTYTKFTSNLIINNSSATGKCLSSHFVNGADEAGKFKVYSDNWINIFTEPMTLTEFKTWLTSNNVSIYYASTETDIEITDTTLISQLEAIYNTAKSYKGTTHVYTEVEEGNIAPILDATAIMDLNALVQK